MTKRSGATRPPEPEESPASDLDWDEVVDVVCVSSGPGPMACAILGARRGLRVISVAQPQMWDAGAASYIAEMTAGLSTAAPNREPVVTRARPAEAEPAPLETFVGTRLRDWSALCWASAFGVLYTDVIGTGMTPMRTDDDLRVLVAALGIDPPGSQALADWVAAQAHEHDVQPDPDVRLQRLIFEHGRVAGVELLTGSGPLLVRALGGVALPTVSPDVAASVARPAARPDRGEVAIVGLPASRFGRVDLLTPGPSETG